MVKKWGSPNSGKSVKVSKDGKSEKSVKTEEFVKLKFEQKKFHRHD